MLNPSPTINNPPIALIFVITVVLKTPDKIPAPNVIAPWYINTVTAENITPIPKDDVKIIDDIPKKTKLIYFTDEINKYMQASDIIITKPGGLTVTEALACNIPMAVFDAIPGQEEENAEFLLKHNMAVRIKDGDSCRNSIVELLKDEGKLENMKEACKSFDKNDSTKNIFLLINELIANNNLIENDN